MYSTRSLRSLMRKYALRKFFGDNQFRFFADESAIYSAIAGRSLVGSIERSRHPELKVVFLLVQLKRNFPFPWVTKAFCPTGPNGREFSRPSFIHRDSAGFVKSSISCLYSVYAAFGVFVCNLSSRGRRRQRDHVFSVCHFVEDLFENLRIRNFWSNSNRI